MRSLRLLGMATLPAGLGLAAVSFALAHSTGCGGNAFTAGTEEGGVSDAGPLDAGDGGGSGTKGFCASLDAGQFPFCSDFDEKALPENWVSVLAPGSASVTEDPDASVSPPNSLLAFAPVQSLTDGGSNGAFVSKSGGLPKGAVHIAFDVRIDKLSFPAGATSSSSIVPLLYTQGNRYELLVAFVPSTTSAFSLVLYELTGPLTSVGDAGTTGTAHSLSTLLSQPSLLQTWLPVHIDFNLDQGGSVGGPVTATFALGTASTQVTLNPPVGTAAGDRTFTLGVEAIGQTDEASIRFDNVTYSN